MDRWRAWQTRWRKRVYPIHHLTLRRALASALHRWRLITSATMMAEHDRLQRRIKLERVLTRFVLRKCFSAFAENADKAGALRSVLTSWLNRILLKSFEVWRHWLRRKQDDPHAEIVAPPQHVDVVPPRGIDTRFRRIPGNPRKAHCRCVYAVSRGERCTCAPASHLLRRVEELRSLIAHGLDARAGGYHLLSHVVQGTAKSISKRNGGDSVSREAAAAVATAAAVKNDRARERSTSAAKSRRVRDPFVQGPASARDQSHDSSAADGYRYLCET